MTCEWDVGFFAAEQRPAGLSGLASESRNASRRRTGRRNEKSVASGYGKFRARSRWRRHRSADVRRDARHRGPVPTRPHSRRHRPRGRCSPCSASPRGVPSCRQRRRARHRAAPAARYATDLLPRRRVSRAAPLSRRNGHQSAAFSLITNRSCKPLSGRYYREHSDGVDRRFSRGRIRASHPGRFRLLHPTVSPWVPDHKELPLELVQALSWTAGGHVRLPKSVHDFGERHKTRGHER